MEKKTNYYMEGMPYGFENLTPLLKNEYRLRNGKNKNEKKIEKKKKKSESPVNKPAEDLNVTKSVNENSVDLVINVELRKRESNYMDAYYTDVDLQGRKAYHAYGKKQDVPKTNLLINNLTKFSDLNLMFSDNVANYSFNSKQNCFFNNEHGKNVTDGSLEQLLQSAEDNIQSFYNDYQNSKTTVKQNTFFMKSSEKRLVKNQSPLYYTNVLNKKYLEKYDFPVNRYVPNEPEHIRLMRANSEYDSSDSLSKVSITYTNNRQKFRTYDLKVPPLTLNVCNKNFVSVKNAVSIKNCVSQHYQHGKENQCEKLAVTFSDPEINQQRRQLPSEQIQLRKMCSLMKISDNPCKIKMYEDQSYSRSTSYEHSRPTYKSQYFEENFSKFDNTNDFNRLIVDQNSYITDRLSSSEECQDKFSQFKDKYYLKKKFHREQYHRCHLEKPVENSELSNILDIDETCLLDFNPLKKSTQDEFLNIENSKSELKQNQSCWITPKKVNEKILLKNINLESSSKMKTLEVLFPVKSLRICMDEIDKSCGHKTNATNDPFVTSVTEVEVTKNTIIKKTEVMEESVSKIISDRNCEDGENKELFNIHLNRTLITREIKDDKTVCTKNNRNHIDLKMILSSNEFKKEVMNIIEQYLKENYLKDDNFDVIVVPKTDKSIPYNPIDTLKRIISSEFCPSECDSVVNMQSFEVPDLSMFNPRDFKGHVAKYEKMYHEHPTIRSTNKSIKKKSIECSNCAEEERCNRFRPATSKTIELKAIDIDETHKSLTKYQSMPAFKIKSQKNSISMKNPNPKPRKTISHQQGTNGNENITTDNAGCKNKSYRRNFDRKCLKTAEVRNKCAESEFLTEFNEFKEIFDEVEVHHNALLDVLNYDPCGLLFKIKKGPSVSGKTKRLPNK